MCVCLTGGIVICRGKTTIRRNACSASPCSNVLCGFVRRLVEYRQIDRTNSFPQSLLDCLQKTPSRTKRARDSSPNTMVKCQNIYRQHQFQSLAASLVCVCVVSGLPYCRICHVNASLKGFFSSIQKARETNGGRKAGHIQNAKRARAVREKPLSLTRHR